MFGSMRHICPAGIPLFGRRRRTLAAPGGIFGTVLEPDEAEMTGRVARGLEEGNGDNMSSSSALSAAVVNLLEDR